MKMKNLAIDEQNEKERCSKCGSENIVMVEYFDPNEKKIPFKHQYDGISEIKCLDCKVRIGRWSKRVLEGDDYERIWGELE